MARMPSIMNHDFSRVPRAQISRSSFDRSHSLKTTFNSGFLVPIFWDEALPGDTFNLNMNGFARMATPLHPFMDNLYFNTFFFSVPLRLLWANFQRFMGEQLNPGDSTDFLVPVLNATTTRFDVGSLYDYFTFPTGVSRTTDNLISALYCRAYNLIWNEWFRDQNLQARVTVSTGDGPDSIGSYTLLRRGKRHDYFTSSLPWPQKGDSVDIPLGISAPVRADVNSDQPIGIQNISGDLRWMKPTTVIEMTGTAATPGTGMYADLQDAIAPTINQLRQAFQLQKLLERDARGGTRYTELIRAHFNVVSPDARLQRPEYLGGGQSVVNLHTVPQTSNTGGGSPTPQANLAAYGTASLNGHGFTQSFTEHCIVIGLVSVRADLTYQQGINRAFSRRTKYDYFWPALAHLGEQAVLSKEIYSDGSAADQTVWGYQERYAEYRYKPSVITGQFRSSFAQTLDTWHLGQFFATRPLLNAAFIQDDPPIERVIAVPSEPEFIFDAYFKYRCARPMPVYGVPGNMDRF